MARDQGRAPADGDNDDTHRGRATATSATPSSRGGQQLDGECKPIIERMEKIQAITRAAADPANLERPDGGAAAMNGAKARTW